MKTVRSFSNPADAQLAASVLEGSGLNPQLRDLHTVSVDWLYANAVGGIRLDVPDSEYEEALEILNLPSQEKLEFCCPHCGSNRVKPRTLSGISALGFVFLGFVLPVVSRRADCLDCKRSLKFKETEDGIQFLS